MQSCCGSFDSPYSPRNTVSVASDWTRIITMQFPNDFLIDIPRFFFTRERIFRDSVRKAKRKSVGIGFNRNSTRRHFRNDRFKRFFVPIGFMFLFVFFERKNFDIYHHSIYIYLILTCEDIGSFKRNCILISNVGRVWLISISTTY